MLNSWTASCLLKYLLPATQTCCILFSVSTKVTAVWMSPCVKPSVTLARELRSKLSVNWPPLLVIIFFQSTMWTTHVYIYMHVSLCYQYQLTHSGPIVWSGDHDNPLVHTTESFYFRICTYGGTHKSVHMCTCAMYMYMYMYI